jgi:hypothetical protein
MELPFAPKICSVCEVKIHESGDRPVQYAYGKPATLENHVYKVCRHGKRPGCLMQPALPSADITAAETDRTNHLV